MTSATHSAIRHSRAITASATRVRLCAGLAIGVSLIGGFAGTANAQPRVSRAMFSMPSMPGTARYNRPAQDDEDDGEDLLAEDGGRMGRMEQPKMPKTDLGRAIIQGDITRDARSVLAARAKLASEAREKLLAPAKAEDSNEHGGESNAAPGAGPVDAAPAERLPDPNPGAAAATPGTPISPEQFIAMMSQDMPPEARAEALEAISRAQATGGAAAMGEDDPTGAAADDEGGEGDSAPDAPEAGGGKPGADADKTPEAVKKRREQQERTRKQAEHFRLLIVAGEWDDVGRMLKDDVKDDAEAIYEWMLTNLLGADSALVPDEIIEISDASPVEMNDRLISKLGGLLKATQSRGCQAGAVAARIAQGTRHFGGQDPVKRKRAAGLLVAAGLPIQAQSYLAPISTARQEQDVELLNLYAIYYAALAKERTGQERDAAVESAFGIALESLGIEKAPARERSKAIAIALSLIHDMPADAGDTFLRSLFVKESDTGWEAIERINRRCQNLRMRGSAPDKRMQNLNLVQRVGRAILANPPETIAAWRTGLNMLTLTIMDEAEFTRASAGQAAARARYNPYGYDEYGGGADRLQPIPADQLGKALPDARWLLAIDAGLAAKLELMAASTAAGAGDTQGVLDMIRPIVATDPERARKLAEALLAAWPAYVGGGRTEEYDPYGGGYGYGYPRHGGYGSTGAVPLTRAKQQRNLEKLHELVKAVNDLHIPNLPADGVVSAFAASYSPAEVYTREHIELVFGDIEGLDNATRMKIAGKMREQLASAWRSPQVQEQAGTKRSNAEMAAEVLRGYDLARELAGNGADTWERLTLDGDLYYDQAEFVYGQSQDMTTYDGLRSEAFNRYRRAATMYKDSLASGKTKPSARVYVQWFSAALGASDLGFLTRQDRPDLQQVDDVRSALAELPGDFAAKHVGLFAQEIMRATDRMNPELKPRFLTEACRVIGEHPDGKAARDKLAYYDDLDKEVELAAVLDSTSAVGVNEPFGVQVGIRSTRAVTRETGGFGKYLMNEQYNYSTGQQVNYRDDFEKMLREKWGAAFDIASITFHKPMLQPLSAGREGWEFTPLAYVLMKAKDAKTDRLPPLKLDMDFADGGGLVVLPVTSDVVALDARTPPAPSEIADLAIEQVLDDREAPTGIVRLEVRATGKGLIPAYDRLLTSDFGPQLAPASIEDHGVSITELDVSTGKVVPVAERTWTVTLKPRAGAGADFFAFPTSAQASAKLSNKRYSDADVVDAPPSLTIAAVGSGGSGAWPWMVGAGVLAVGAIAGVVHRRRSRSKSMETPESSWRIPEVVTPVGAISMLRRVASLNGSVLSLEEQRDLDSQISGLERVYFAPAGSGPGSGPHAPAPDELKAIVARWVDKVPK